MNIFEYASKMEQDGEKFYLELAEKVKDKGLKSILLMLAKDEQEHDKVLQKIAKDSSIDFPASNILKDSENIFETLKKDNKTFQVPKETIPLFKKVLQIEKDAVKLYTDKYNESSNIKEKEILVKIANEEKKHVKLIENIIEHITKPDSWIEDAEFGNRDSY